LSETPPRIRLWAKGFREEIFGRHEGDCRSVLEGIPKGESRVISDLFEPFDLVSLVLLFIIKILIGMLISAIAELWA
jgi:hypothetical protein